MRAMTGRAHDWTTETTSPGRRRGSARRCAAPDLLQTEDAVEKPEQLVVPADDLHPVGLLGARRVASPIRAGDQVEVTLDLADGTTTSFTALAKDTTGGEENYENSGPDAPMTMAPASSAAGHGG
jgi:hypothetical protein